jgi:hypothetical protein
MTFFASLMSFFVRLFAILPHLFKPFLSTHVSLPRGCWRVNRVNMCFRMEIERADLAVEAFLLRYLVQ